MPYRLSDPAWVAFQSDIDVTKLNLPPWGGIVQWGSEFILVYICQADGTLCRKGEVMLTDVSDRAELIKAIPKNYDPNAGVWIYQAPAAFVATLFQEAKAVIETTGVVIQTVAEQAGAAAGAIAKPILSDLSLPIALALIGLVVIYAPRTHP